MKLQLPKTIAVKSKLISSIFGLTIVSSLNIAEPVKASSLSCGPGDNWIETCSSQSYDFSDFVTISVNFGFSPNNQPDFTANLTGKTTLFLGNPVDAIIDDPLLGNVGTVDGILDVIKIEMVSSVSSGPTPFVPLITAIAGDTVPDLAPTPLETDLPFESLYSAGAIVQNTDNPAQADAFLKLFLEIQGTPEGVIRIQEPLTLTSSSPLTSFPDLSSINFVNGEIIELFDAGEDGIFWTGDENEVARLVPDASGLSVGLNLTTVSEPSTLLPLVFFGLGIMRQSQKRK